MVLDRVVYTSTDSWPEVYRTLARACDVSVEETFRFDISSGASVIYSLIQVFQRILPLAFAFLGPCSTPLRFQRAPIRRTYSR